MWLCYDILSVSVKILHRRLFSDSVLNTGVYNFYVNVVNLRSSTFGISNLVTT